MSEVLKAVPKADKVATGVEKVAVVADGLTKALADTYRLMFKTHAYHWNVEGPFFHSIHILTEGQYQNLFVAADELAERIRALGKLAPSQLSELESNSGISDKSRLPSAQDMVEELAADHEMIAKRMHAIIEKAEEAKDPVTADLLTGRCAFHEKAAWMLRATAK